MRRLYFIIIALVTFLQGYCQCGYWFQSQFIELEKGDTSCFYVQSKGSKSIIESYLTYVRENYPESEVVELMTGCYKIKNIDRPQITGLYVSDIYHTKEVDWVIVKPRISLQLKPNYDITIITRKYEGILSEAGHRMSVYRLNCNVSNSDEVLGIVSELSKEDGVEWCEPVKLSSWKHYNTKYSQQYYLKNTGQDGGTVGIDINVEPAWNITSGNSNITVAVIDEGVDHNHEDLSNCVTKPGYIPCLAFVADSAYVQNKTINGDVRFIARQTFIGSDVCNTMGNGPVTIQCGKTTIHSPQGVTIKNDFEVTLGCELDINTN